MRPAIHTPSIPPPTDHDIEAIQDALADLMDRFDIAGGADQSTGLLRVGRKLQDAVAIIHDAREILAAL